MTDLRADLKADLLADLAPTPTPEPAVVTPEALPADVSDATPALSVQWTPLRWSRPKVVSGTDGVGKAVRVGPFTVELSVRP